MSNARITGTTLSLKRPDGTELECRAGEITVLLGPNGAGKSSLLETIAGLRPPEDLTIRYGAAPLWIESKKGKRRLNTEALRSYAYASQNPEEQLTARTVRDELDSVLKPYRLTDEEKGIRLSRALEAVGWEAAWLPRYPFHMSGGERRRLALACLLAAPANWLLLDEPTAGLDAAGHELLADRLRRRRDEGQGILLVSHDSEWALPLADRILLLSPDGYLRDCSVTELLRHPQWWAEAGMEVPEWLATIEPLLRHGMPAAIALNPLEAAAAWGEILVSGGEVAIHESGVALARSAENGAGAAAKSDAMKTEGGNRLLLRPRRGAELSERSNPLSAFDPRSVWLSYVLLSFSILSLKDWRSVMLAAAIAIVEVALFRLPLWRWRVPLAGFLLFSLLVSFTSGLGAGGTIDTAIALDTLRTMTKTLLVMLLGLGLATAITPLRIRRSLEQLLSAGGKLANPLQRFILTVTLMLRFVPVFLDEWGRFARYAIARGKDISRSPKALVERSVRTALPFMLALFRLGEQIAAALESRGVGRRQPTLVKSLRWGMRDSLLVIMCSAAALVLLVTSRL